MPTALPMPPAAPVMSATMPCELARPAGRATACRARAASTRSRTTPRRSSETKPPSAARAAHHARSRGDRGRARAAPPSASARPRPGRRPGSARRAGSDRSAPRPPGAARSTRARAACHSRTPLDDPLAQRRRVLGRRVELDPDAAGAACARGGRGMRRRPARARATLDPQTNSTTGGRRVDLEDPRAVDRDGAAERRAGLGEQVVAAVVVERFDRCACRMPRRRARAPRRTPRRG